MTVITFYHMIMSTFVTLNKILLCATQLFFQKDEIFVTAIAIKKFYDKVIDNNYKGGKKYYKILSLSYHLVMMLENRL